MSRRAGTGSRIRGPQSALTDYLASHNISAHQISLDFQRRQREQETVARVSDNDDEDKENDDGEDRAEREKRKRKQEKALNKIKQSKEFKRRKYEMQNNGDSDAEMQDDDSLARTMLAKNKPLPGQLENCEICEKRFTVTPYTLAGPNGGLLCTKCGKSLKNDEKKAQTAAKKKNAAQKGRKRQTESDRMMGDVKPGAKSLLEACVRRVADVVTDIDDFGDMPQNLLDRLSQILSKKRVLTSRTLDLFLRQDLERIDIYDCGRLEKEDFQKIFAFMPDLELVNLRFAGQMKDDALMYMIEKSPKIRHLQLGATNLISDTAWVELFHEAGPRLESLKLSELNDSLNDASMKELVSSCQHLKRLKLRSCSHLTEESIAELANLNTLEHITLKVAQNETLPPALCSMIDRIGANLKTLCLEEYIESDDTVLATIKQRCTNLSKLRFTGSALCTDTAFANLFTNWQNPPLTYIDLSDNRDVESANLHEDPSEQVGFGSLSLPALMKHSGERVETLNLHSCRHISHAALCEVFDGKKKYLNLRDVDLSFVQTIDDVVLAGIFRSCPALTKLAVFSCFNARAADIPAGVAVIGLPNAQDSIVVEHGFGDEV